MEDLIKEYLEKEVPNHMGCSPDAKIIFSDIRGNQIYFAVEKPFGYGPSEADFIYLRDMLIFINNKTK
jgi:hypothetical protein